jgi:hypothetical protein
VVEDSEGVLYVEDVAPVVVCNKVPPVSAVYHLKVPDVTLLALNATDPGPQSEAAVTVGAAGAVPVLTVAVTCVRLLVHPPLSNSTQ